MLPGQDFKPSKIKLFFRFKGFELMENNKKELHILIRDKTALKLKELYEKEYPGEDKSFSVFVENLILFAMSERGVTL
jgi:hypothetical protein